MRTINDLRLFVRASELGSLSAAAREADITPAAASAALKRMEAELGTPLLVRSTRHLRLTQAGEQFLQTCRDVLALLEEGRQLLQESDVRLRGTLQLSAPSDLGRHLLLRWLNAFQDQHPDLSIRLHLSDGYANIYRQPVDAAIRYGQLSDSNLVAAPLVPDSRRHLCASPDYLARHGTPAHPDELTEHNCLRFNIDRGVHDRWRFSNTSQSLTVRVSGNRTSDDGDVVRRWALEGYGIAYKSWLDIAEDVAAGRLILLCPQWLGEPAPLHLVYASRHVLGHALRKLRDHLVAHCKSMPQTPHPIRPDA